MPDNKRPIVLPEITVTAERINPKKYREVKEKVKLYPKGDLIDKYKVDSLRKVGYGDAIGKPIQVKGQADMYGADQSDRIKKLLRK